MGLNDINNKTAESSVTSQIYSNEESTLNNIRKIFEKEQKEGKGYSTTTFGRASSAIGSPQQGVSDIRLKIVNIKNSNGKTISVLSNPIEDINIKTSMILSIDLDSDTKVTITKNADGTIIYTLRSPETGAIDLGEVGPTGLILYNYGNRYDKSLYRLEDADPNLIGISEIDGVESTLRDIIANHINNHAIMGKYSETIMSGFDEILSLDEDREIVPLSQENLERIDLLRQIAELEEENSRYRTKVRNLTESNIKSEEARKKSDEEIQKENSSLQSRVIELEEKLRISEATNKRLSEFINGIKEIISKIPFFGKGTLKRIDSIQTQLPPPAQRTEENNLRNKYGGYDTSGRKIEANSGKVLPHTIEEKEPGEED